MTLTVNINSITQPVFHDVKRSSFIKRFFIKSLEFFLNRSVERLNKTINNSILKIEGSYTHLKEASTEEAETMLVDVKKVISKFEKFSDRLHKSDYFDNDELKSKFKYLLKSIYKAEAIMHKIAYKNKGDL
jgi:hypothetical protein